MAIEPLKIGLLVGREWSWPPAFIEEVARRNDGVIAEFATLGGTQMNEPSPYRVIIDRISHEVPYYRSYLKNLALQGVAVINDPFMWAADDKFFGASLATQLGVASPKTVVLPNKDYVPGIIHHESLRNLKYPLDWDAIIRYIGLPAVLKDAHGGGWKDVYVVRSMEELFMRYNQSGLLTMVLQEFIQWESYARCMCLGQDEIYVMDYDPTTRRYDVPHFAPALHQRLIDDSLKLVRALGYDMNTAEFAIRDGIPYAIDFMNPAPDMDVNSLGKLHFDWMVTHMADLAIRLAKSGYATRDRYQWARVVKEVSDVQADTLAKVAASNRKPRVTKAKPDTAPAETSIEDKIASSKKPAARKSTKKPASDTDAPDTP